MPPARPASWRDVGTRIGGTVTALLGLLVVGVGAGHLALTNGQALLGGLAADAYDEVQAPHGRYRGERHVRRGSGRFVVKHPTRYSRAGEVREDHGTRRSFARHRWCRGRECIKPAEPGAPRGL